MVIFTIIKTLCFCQVFNNKFISEGLRIKGRKPDQFELEEATRKFMNGTPEKYRISLKKMEAAVGNEVLPPGGRPAVEAFVTVHAGSKGESALICLCKFKRQADTKEM